MKTKHTFAFTFILGLVWTGILFAYASGPPSAVNGVFGSTNTCNQSGCHNTFALNSGTGSVVIGGLPATWTPGQVYPLTVTVSLAGAVRYGFQFTAVNNSTNAQAGTLSAASPNDTRVSICPGGSGCFNDSSLQFAQHNSFANTSGTFSFRWTAPASASFGAVRFNVAGNASNNDLTSTGDRIYTTSSTVSPAAADTTPPVISAVTSSSITTSGATIAWTTDEASDTQVEFGTTTAYGQSTTLNTTLVTAHTASLTGLSASTTYHYRVKSRDAASNLATGGDLTLTTQAAADTTPPVISAVTSSSITTSGAAITWTTDEASDTQVEFGTTTSYGQSTTLNSTLGTAHSANLAGLASNTTYHYRVKSKDALQNLATGVDKTFITAFGISNLGGVSRITDGTGQLVTGYGRILANSGTTPSGIAIFGLRESSGLLVTEAGVPDSPLISSGRIYAEVSADGFANTGIAMVNPNVQDASVTVDIRDTTGNLLPARPPITLKGIGSSCTPGVDCSHLASFLDQAPYLVSLGFQGTVTFTSTAPISVIALRSLLNERTPKDFLITTLPVLDLAAGTSAGTQVIPHFAAGGGWTTQIILVNPGGAPQAGTIQFLDSTGASKTVIVDGTSGSSTSYSVAANSSKKFIVTGGSLASGSVRIVPSGGGPVPTPLVIFSYKPQGITISEAGVPVTMGTAFRMFAQLVSQSPQILTGVAIANPTSVAGTVTLSLTDLNGALIAETNPPLPLPASGQIVGFINELIPSLAGQTVQGVLRISTNNLSSISVVGLRERYITRQPPEDFLITTTPPTLENSASTTAERLFPHLVDGGGWTTQIILFSGTAGQTSGGTLSFISHEGPPLSLNIN